MTQPIEKTVLRVVSLAGLAICVILALWGWKTGILTSQERMEALVAGCGAAGALISMVGDLAASAIKRNFEIKDYGKLIPGHGGILDRFDSVIFTAPIIFYLTGNLLQLAI